MLALTPSARFIDCQQIRILAVEQNVLGTANTVFFSIRRGMVFAPKLTTVREANKTVRERVCGSRP